MVSATVVALVSWGFKVEAFVTSFFDCLNGRNREEHMKRRQPNLKAAHSSSIGNPSVNVLVPGNVLVPWYDAHTSLPWGGGGGGMRRNT